MNLSGIMIAVLIAASFVSDGKEVLHLSGGAKIQGPILKETHDTVFVDLGYTILGIPKKEIVSRMQVEDVARAASSKRADENAAYIDGSEGGERSIEELAAELGSSVVKVSCPSKLGSGFFVNKEGMVITNFHVVEGERKITLTIFERRGDEFEKRKVEKVKIIALNPYYDLAVLQVDPEELKTIKFNPAPMGKITEMTVGESVFAIGNPHGLERTVTKGIVSIKGRAHEGLLHIQTTTQINPGNSGGPLFNLRGEVVGVTNMGYMFSEGLGFAIPVERVKEILDNRESFAFDADNPNSGYRYLAPPKKPDVKN